ncbi:uncharacterized protein LOC142522488 isoform X1 [Primulina tabacum]|uniref:uncharacterized protein LOC142522488 isoform X1 n=1 Tax=Primulina tabacum TaxID=48773 RepID=UPI003F59B2A6
MTGNVERDFISIGESHCRLHLVASYHLLDPRRLLLASVQIQWHFELVEFPAIVHASRFARRCDLRARQASMGNTDRSWMYRRLENEFLSSEFCVGVETLVSFALSHPECLLDGKSRRPCNRKKCRNKCFDDAETVKFHLGRYGFVPNYYCWQLSW